MITVRCAIYCHAGTHDNLQASATSNIDAQLPMLQEAVPVCERSALLRVMRC